MEELDFFDLMTSEQRKQLVGLLKDLFDCSEQDEFNSVVASIMILVKEAQVE